MSNDETSQPAFNQEYYSWNRPEIQRLVSPTARRILDIGCAAGLLGFELKQKLQAEVWGVECMPLAAAKACERLDHTLQGRIEETLPLLPVGYFDTIIMADVLEHLMCPEHVLHSLRDKLAAGGELVASIPNVRHWQVLKNLLEGRWEYVDSGILDRTHLRFFTVTDGILLFENAGYTILHREAVILHEEAGIPEAVVGTLGDIGLNVGTLAEESRIFQILFRATPKG